MMEEEGSRYSMRKDEIKQKDVRAMMIAHTYQRVHHMCTPCLGIDMHKPARER